MSMLRAAVAAFSTLVLAAGAAAQTVPSESAAPSAQVKSAPASAMRGAQVTYRSAFDGYRRYADQPVESWNKANDTVRQIGGWQAYAREAQAVEGASQSSKKEAQERPASPTSGHAGHH